ncbi:DNA oxidative demethylase AlkB [Diaphorobacter aerolatus]|uniref:DNA oxidative demethylase AlkB n=1 Tax=Diaphorobacter aerolatus TaxID=1288495 RepID=A0A7H0GNP0_9BURK|nr:DNA oxidative demethylase AlkB [Diaphorobacter aerolatus]QNP49906.1 DNA oxidative demethylase AlkB [Diaphorobacter aerolatus]
MTASLFDDDPHQRAPLWLGEEAVLLKGLALADADAMMRDIETITQCAPFRHMVTPGGRAMSVATSSCGDLGWVSDLRGYRYAPTDPESGQPWPAIPERWLRLAMRARELAGFASAGDPDACLINRYAPGARLSLHQDRDERDFGAPIVSVSLGLPAVFLWGGDKRSDPYRTIPLEHGDVLIWGGVDRLRFHGVRPVAQGGSQQAPGFRYNITMRKAA